MKLSRAAGSALDLLYPPRCPVCHEPAPHGTDICPECRRKIPYITAKRCRKCGKPVDESAVLCDDCLSNGHSYTQGKGILVYDDTMRVSIAAFKYRNRREYAKTYARIMFEEAEEDIRKWNPDVLVPIPIHLQRLLKRGYNQAALIAEELSIRSGIPVNANLLARMNDTKVMKELDRRARRTNMAHVLAVTGRPVPRKILLVDDIYTTGSTVDAASDVLRNAGAEQVFFLTVCIGGGFMVRY